MDKITEISDESLLRWRMSIEEEDGNLIEEEENVIEPLLKTVVRTSYLYHLRQSLRKNLESSKQKNITIVEENMVNKVIKGCSAMLEEKCLRNCMIARLYQRMMAQMIKEVKKATTEGQLFSALKDFAEHQSQVPVSTHSDKEVQTDIDSVLFTNQIANLYNQTQTLLEKMNTESMRTCNNSLDRLHNSNDGESTSSNFVKKSQNESKLINGVRPVNNWCVKCKRETINVLCDHSPPLINKDVNLNGVDNYTDLKTKPNLNGVDARIIAKRKNTDLCSQNVGSNAQPKIDELFECPPNELDKNDSFQLKLKSPSFVECIALWYNLECDLEELSPSKRQKLDEKFSQLFGKDHAIDYFFLTDEQKSITCRKRIAKYVVVELTNYYSKKKIASKQLFKTMAKHITSILLGRSLFPDPADIKKSVAEFFIDGRVVNSEDDFYF